MKRKTEWPEILIAEIEAARERPFSFGRHDCCIFAANIVRAMTGVDLMKGLRRYRSAASAARIMRRAGHERLVAMITSVMREHGCTSVRPSLARRGDVVMAKVSIDGGATEWAAGICVGREAVFASDGLVFLTMSEIERAWRCG